MRLGLIADIHANLPALEAVLEALRREGVEEVLVLGDLLVYGPHPRQVLRRIRAEGFPVILGEWDERVAYPLPEPIPRGIAQATLDWTRAQLEAEDLRYLRALGRVHRRQYGEDRLLAVHGRLPRGEEAGPDLSLREALALLEGYGVRYLLPAGRHFPWVRPAGAGLLADPGSVGLSLSGAHGADALVLDTLTGETKALKVPYDLGPLVFDLEAWGLPPVLKEVYRTGSFPQEG